MKDLIDPTALNELDQISEDLHHAVANFKERAVLINENWTEDLLGKRITDLTEQRTNLLEKVKKLEWEAQAQADSYRALHNRHDLLYKALQAIGDHYVSWHLDMTPSKTRADMVAEITSALETDAKLWSEQK